MQILVENRRFNLPHLYLTPPLGVTPLEFCRDLWHQKTGRITLSSGVKNIAGRFFGLVTKHACDRQTDGQTDRQNYDSQDHASIAASRSKNTYGVYFLAHPVQCTKKPTSQPSKTYLSPDIWNNVHDGRSSSFFK